MLQKIAIYSSSNLMYKMKIGFGKDIHILKKGYPLILGGIKIPFNKGLFSYSDGDVVIHSLVDAILGALCLGDIGEMFPNTDERNKGRCSVEFLKEMKPLLEKNNFKISNIDIMICCEKPRLAEYINVIRGSIAVVLGIDVNKVSIKAGTNEGLGVIGRGKAIEATSVVLLEEV